MYQLSISSYLFHLPAYRAVTVNTRAPHIRYLCLDCSLSGSRENAGTGEGTIITPTHCSRWHNWMPLSSFLPKRYEQWSSMEATLLVCVWLDVRPGNARQATNVEEIMVVAIWKKRWAYNMSLFPISLLFHLRCYKGTGMELLKSTIFPSCYSIHFSDP